MRNVNPISVEEHNERMNRDAERNWNASVGAGRRTSQEMVVVEHVQQPMPTAVMNPLDLPQADFKHALQVKSDNRQVLVQWLKDSLVKGVDYGRIHFKSKNQCAKGSECTNPEHFTKDTLFKPGAQKICGMLGVTPVYPNLGRYEEAAISGQKIESIILRCQIVSMDQRVLSEGVGARSVSQDYGDLNKALKMASKSAHIDATLSMAGLSEIFCHPDQPPEPPGKGDEPNHSAVPCGRFQGQLWADMTLTYLQGVINSDKAPASLKQGAAAELKRRPTSEFDDDIPF